VPLPFSSGCAASIFEELSSKINRCHEDEKKFSQKFFTKKTKKFFENLHHEKVFIPNNTP